MINELHFSDWAIIISTLTGLLVAASSYAWVASQWLSRQFAATRLLIDSKIEKLENNIVSKLEYHEKHDDIRFGNISEHFNKMSDDIWNVRLRNARKDGLESPNRKVEDAR